MTLIVLLAAIAVVGGVLGSREASVSSLSMTTVTATTTGPAIIGACTTILLGSVDTFWQRNQCIGHNHLNDPAATQFETF